MSNTVLGGSRTIGDLTRSYDTLKKKYGVKFCIIACDTRDDFNDKVDNKKFPCLDFAYQAAKTAGTAPAVMNAVNEEAVSAFLDQRIGFTLIPDIIEKIMSKHKTFKNPNLPAILEADTWARQEARVLIKKLED